LAALLGAALNFAIDYAFKKPLSKNFILILRWRFVIFEWDVVTMKICEADGNVK